MDETRQFFFLFHKVVVFCVQQPFRLILIIRFRIRLFPLKPFFGLFFFLFCYCSFVCAGRPCLESSCCHGNGRMAFCSGLNSKNRAEKKNIALQLSLSFSLPLSLYAYKRCKWSSEEKSVFNSHTHSNICYTSVNEVACCSIRPVSPHMQY